MNYWELTAWIAAAAALATAGIYRQRLTETSRTLKAYAQLIAALDEMAARRMSLIYRPILNAWCVVEKTGNPDGSPVVALDDNWATAVQNAVYKKRSDQPLQ